MSLRAACAFLCLWAVLGPGGCRSGQATRDADAGPLPAYDEVAAAFNAERTPLTRLWARTVIKVWFPDEKGEEQTEQVEGHFQYIRPDKVLLTFNKVGETYALLGSNADSYWWFELGKERRAYVGAHAGATPEHVRRLGVPVHPLELIGVLALDPLPTPAPEGARIERSAKGLLLSIPSGGGERRLLLDPRTYRPRRVEFTDGEGHTVLAADLERYAEVKVAFGTRPPRIATRFIITIDDGRAWMKLWLSDTESKEGRPKPGAFDLDRLKAAYRVTTVESLDEEPAQPRRRTP